MGSAPPDAPTGKSSKTWGGWTMDTKITVRVAVQRELEDAAAEMGAQSLGDAIARLLDIRRATMNFVKAQREGASDEELNKNLFGP